VAATLIKTFQVDVMLLADTWYLTLDRCINVHPAICHLNAKVKGIRWDMHVVDACAEKAFAILDDFGTDRGVDTAPS